MPLTDLTANFVGAAGGGFEPQRVNDAQLIITGLSVAGGSKDDVVMLALATCPIPKVQTGIIEIGFLNERRKFPGRTTYEDMTVTFHDYCDKDTAKILWLWRQMVQDHVSGATGLARNIKKDAYLTLYGPEGSNATGINERKYHLTGVWPSTMDPGDTDQNGEGDVMISMVLAIDKYYPVFAGIGA
jgi:hypothetical protein